MTAFARLTLAIAFVSVASGCGAGSPAADPGPERRADSAVPEPEPNLEDTAVKDTETDPRAQARFDALERRLESASYVAFDARITSEGLIETELEGTFELTPDAVIVAFEGSFGGEPVEPILQAGRVAVGGNDEQTFEIERPLHLNQSLLIGLTRMGLLHNLAVLTRGEPPDRADGTIKAWVTISNLQIGAETEVDGRASTPISFALTVDGRTGGRATLYLDADSGVPLRREQTVQFEGGEMRVVERYGRFIVEP